MIKTLISVVLLALDKDGRANVWIGKGREIAEPLPSIVVGVSAGRMNDPLPQCDALLHLLLDGNGVLIAGPGNEVLEPSSIGQSLDLGS